MYVDTSTVTAHGTTYTRHLLGESYRENGKVKHRTIANLSRASPEEIEAIRLALRHKGNLQELGDVHQDVTLRQGLSVGAVWTLWEMARQLGIAAARGITRLAAQAAPFLVIQGDAIRPERRTGRYRCHREPLTLVRTNRPRLVHGKALKWVSATRGRCTITAYGSTAYAGRSYP